MRWWTDLGLCLVLGTAACLEGFRVQRDPNLDSQQILGPGTFLIILGGALLVLAVVVIATRASYAAADALKEEGVTNPFAPAILVAFSVLFCIAMPYLGFLASIMLLSLAVFYFVSRFKVHESLFASVLLGGAFYVLFVVFFSIPFPAGRLLSFLGS